ncbi:hypothetical protein H671_1g2687 [Cricetulus griseus]|nr:hypothetical protein H671_1g2687 [Cricetulus griseus]
MCSATAVEEGPRGQDAKWRTPTARVRKTGDLQSARARQAEGEEEGWLKTRNREKSPLLHQKVGSVNASPEQELIRNWTWCKRPVQEQRWEIGAGNHSLLLCLSGVTPEIAWPPNPPQIPFI